MKNMTRTVALIGAGKMATAVACGLLKAGIAKIQAYDVSAAAAEAFQKATGIKTSASLSEAVGSADTVILAVKPQFAAEALKDAKSLLNGKLFISIAAGLPLEFLMEKSGQQRVVRVMPNTPALAGAGMSCFAPASGATAEDVETVSAILSSFGRCRQVAERQLDAVTGLSGSAPAYVLEFIMGLADGGVYAGLPRDMALELAAQTVFGTAKLCLESTQHPAVLRDAVISPAGTTARGVMVLEKAGFAGIAAEAVIAAADRSAELSKGK